MVPTFAPDGSVNVCIESPRGATAKWKHEDGLVRLQRPLPAGFCYPYDWGFVPGTRAADGDPLDAVVCWQGNAYPGVIIRVRPLGLLRVEQANRRILARERNDRLIAVPTADPTQSATDILQLPTRVREEIEHFFSAVVAFEQKDLVLLGWGSADEAYAAIAAARV